MMLILLMLMSARMLPRNHSHAGPPYYVFLDEKWFYISSRRAKIKFLPKQPHEMSSDEAHYPSERLASRRFVQKVMFIGVMACPHPDRNFDGKVLMLRVSQTKIAQKKTYFKLIVDDYTVNKEINANWRDLHDLELVPDDFTVAGWLDSIEEVEEWGIDERTRSHLVIWYCTYTAKGEKSGLQ